MGRLEIDCISRSYDDHVHTQQRADVRSSIASGVVSRLPRELCILHLRLHPGTLELTGIWPHSCAKGQCTRILRLPHEERPVAAYEDLRGRLKVSRSSCRRTSCLSHCLASLTQLAASRIFAYRCCTVQWGCRNPGQVSLLAPSGILSPDTSIRKGSG